MNDKIIKILGAIGGLCFFVSFFIYGLVSILGLIIGIFLLTKAKEYPKAKTHGLIVIVLNAIAFLFGVLPMIFDLI